MAKKKTKDRTPPIDQSFQEQLLKLQKNETSDKIDTKTDKNSEEKKTKKMLSQLGLSYKSVGSVKEFNSNRNFGFIKSNGGDVTLHQNQINDGTVPEKGDKYVYDLHIRFNGRRSARNAKRIYCEKLKSWGLSKSKVPNHNLDDWAFIPMYPDSRGDKALVCLSKLAAKEDWRSRQSYHEEIELLGGLRNYITYTFTRLRNEKKVFESTSLAAFNTGLETDRHNQIIAIFEPNDQDKQKWKWKSFYAVDKEKDGNFLITEFDKIPERAKYIDCCEDVKFDSKKFDFAKDHIIIDGIRKDRFPPSFLDTNLSNFSVDDYRKITCSKERANYLNKIALALGGDSNLQTTLLDRLEESFNQAKLRVKQNPSDAVPIYYPREDSTALLLPLSLSDQSKVDRALVVTKESEGDKIRYFGKTIFPLFYAYQSARLISPPCSDWLTVDSYAGVGGLN